MNNSWGRMAVGVFMPAIIGTSLLFLLMSFVTQPQSSMPSSLYADGFKGMLVFAYMFVGIQSIIYSMIMEFWINPKIKSSFIVVGISAALGTLSGVVIFGYFLAIIGFLTGLIVGLYLRYSYAKESSITGVR